MPEKGKAECKMAYEGSPGIVYIRTAIVPEFQRDIYSHIFRKTMFDMLE